MRLGLAFVRRARRDRSGAVAVMVAAMLPVLIGAAALSVDFSYYRYAQNRLQSAADVAALAGISKIDSPGDVVPEAIDYAGRNVPSGFGPVTTAADVDIGVWDPATRTFAVAAGADVNAVRVSTVRNEARGNLLPTFLMQFFRGAPNVRATAIAARHLVVQYEPPERTDLDNEAGDFNEIYAYCYDYQGSGAPADRRSQMTLISNNMSGQNIVAISGGVINKVPDDPLVWPVCEKGQSLSFRLRNVRHAKSIPDLWANPTSSPQRPEFNHYTDTQIADGVEQFNGLDTSILETVRCDTADQCDPARPGNVIPDGGNRNPQVSGEPCLPGKFMYFGWEDRPPGQSGASGNWTDPAWTDTDFDDIRIVMRCPRTGRLGDGMSRLVA